MVQSTQEQLEELREDRINRAVQELFNWYYKGSTCFSAKLYTLMSAADPHNLMRIGVAFPAETAVFQVWSVSPSSRDFFLKCGVSANEIPEVDREV